MLWASFVSGPASLAPSLVAAAAAALWLKQKQLQSVQELRRGISQLPGLCATAMFALAPIPQLVRPQLHCPVHLADAAATHHVDPMLQ